MLHRLPDRLGHGLATLWLLLALAVTALAPLPAAHAQEPAARPAAQALPSQDEIRALIASLEDPAEREALLARLRALIAVAEPGRPTVPDVGTPEGAVAWLVRELTARTAIAHQALRGMVDQLYQIPFLVLWLESQLADPATRALWTEVALRLGLILGVAIGGFVLAATALARVRRRLRRSAGDTLSARAVGALLLLLVELVPVVVFAVLAYATMAALDPRMLTRFVAVALINAAVIVRTGIALLRVILAPHAAGLRLVPLADHDAQFLYRWIRRIVQAAVYGYFALTAARLLGLPWTIHAFLLHILFVAVALIAITMILKARRRVAAALASLDDPSWGEAVRYVPWTAISGIWHLLALLWILVFYVVWSVGSTSGVLFMARATALTLVIVALGWLAVVLAERSLPRPAETRRPAEGEGGEEDAEPPPRRRLPTTHGLARSAIGALALLAVLEAWNFGTLGWILSEPGQAITGRLLNVALVGAIAFGIWKGTSLLVERYLTAKDAQGNILHSNRSRTLFTVLRNALWVFIGVVAGMMILSELGFDITPLLAGAGVIGLAIGFGSQKLVQDIITGLFILLGDTIRVGDVVNVAGKGGVVEHVSLRAVRLRDYAGHVHTIPYSAIDSVTNLTKDFSFYVFDIGVAYREDVDQVIKLMREIGASLQRDPAYRRLILEPLDIAGVDAFADSAVMIKARIKTQPMRQWMIGREFNRRLKRRFDEEGIEIPFPHQTIYFGVDKHGHAPAAPVRVTYTASMAGPEPDEGTVLESGPAREALPAGTPRG